MDIITEHYLVIFDVAVISTILAAAGLGAYFGAWKTLALIVALTFTSYLPIPQPQLLPFLQSSLLYLGVSLLAAAIVIVFVPRGRSALNRTFGLLFALAFAGLVIAVATAFWSQLDTRAADARTQTLTGPLAFRGADAILSALPDDDIGNLFKKH